jgi:hypothetical protein
MRARPTRLLAPLLATVCLLTAACLLAACTAAVGGSGKVGLPPAPTYPEPTYPVPGPPTSIVPGPAVPGGGAPASVHCPTVSDPAAGLSFRCVSPDITERNDVLWPLNLGKTVEKGWALGEGAAGIIVPSGTALQQITHVVLQEMIALQYWGPNPGVTTVSSAAATVAGVDAWVQRMSFTINPNYRTQQGLTVRTEHTWLVAMQLESTEVALWYVTLPDEVKQLWPTVPALIKSIKRI